ncbi:MAG: putative General secretion pathway protein GspG, partial [Parcubacteria group bacterium Gr01-1014_66]
MNAFITKTKSFSPSPPNSKFQLPDSTHGFTLIELLVVIAIIGVLASIVFASLNSARVKARNAERIRTLKTFQTALELYYADHGKYPNEAGGSGWWGFDYTARQSDGSCSGAVSLGFNNSASIGFLEVLYDGGYTSEREWTDPLNPVLGSVFNCRYIVPTDERDVDNVQHYLLHCNLENDPAREASDGGTNPTLYEIVGGDPWICVT